VAKVELVVNFIGRNMNKTFPKQEDWNPPTYQRFPSSYRKFSEKEEFKFRLEEAVILSTKGSKLFEEVDGIIGFIVEVLSNKTYKVYWEENEMVLTHEEDQLISVDR
jgi:hypothetical protein